MHVNITFQPPFERKQTRKEEKQKNNNKKNEKKVNQYIKMRKFSVLFLILNGKCVVVRSDDCVCVSVLSVYQNG